MIQIIYGLQYFIDPINFHGRENSWYFVGTLKYRTENYFVFDEVDMVVEQYNDDINTYIGDNIKFCSYKFKLTY
jgi:hypothetical protein